MERSTDVAINVNEETKTVVAAFSYETAAAILAAEFALQDSDAVFGNDDDLRHWIAFASAIKARFDLLEVLPD